MRAVLPAEMSSPPLPRTLPPRRRAGLRLAHATLVVFLVVITVGFRRFRRKRGAGATP